MCHQDPHCGWRGDGGAPHQGILSKEVKTVAQNPSANLGSSMTSRETLGWSLRLTALQLSILQNSIYFGSEVRIK